MLSALFVYEGARALASPEPLVDRAKPVTDRIAPLLAKAPVPVPTETKRLVQLNAATQLTGGLLLASGHLPRPTATLLAGSLAATTMARHPYWRETDPAARRMQRTQFLKNLGVLGGLLLAAADTQGRPGLRWRTSYTMRSAQNNARIARRSAGARRRASG